MRVARAGTDRRRGGAGLAWPGCLPRARGPRPSPSRVRASSTAAAARRRERGPPDSGRQGHRRRHARVGDAAARGRPRGRQRQDDHAGDDQRARAHGVRGLHHVGRAQPHGREPPRSPAARGLLRRRGGHLGRQQSDRDVAPVPARPGGGHASPRRPLSVHAGHGAAQWRPGSHPARSHERAARRERGDDAGCGAGGDRADGRSTDRAS